MSTVPNAQAESSTNNTDSNGEHLNPKTTRWWRESEWLWLLVIVFIAHFFRLDVLSVRGEESRRGMIAQEILWTGNWVVPSLQGEAWFSRPPLQYWAVAVSIWLRGQCDVIAIRVPSVLATLLTTFLVFGYSRTFLSRMGAFSAAAAFATMGQILKLGRLAETEAVFTLFLSGALLVWHWGYIRRWALWRMWMAGYALAALATLAKGSQGPVYFVGSVTVFLLLMRDWRKLFSVGHLLGILTFLVIFGGWLSLYYQQMGLSGVRRIMSEAASERFYYNDWWPVAKHFVLYPLEIFACMMPWSVMLLGFTRPTFRKAIGNTSTALPFLLTCIFLTFPTCWLAPGARSRYWMPLYPCVAPLIGLVIQRCLEAPAGSTLRKAWGHFLLCCVGLLFSITVLALVGIPLQRVGGLHLKQPAWVASAFAIVLVPLCVLIYRNRETNEPFKTRLAVGALAVCLGLSYSVWLTNVLMNRSVGTRQAVAQLKQKLGPDEKLVSINRIYHLFAFHYRDPIQKVSEKTAITEFPEDIEFFCFGVWNGYGPKIPFAWEKVTVINCDRTLRPCDPEMVVVVGRRLPQQRAEGPMPLWRSSN
ncbi:MAG: ArnT family glycosyltransferase [Gemmataceae bacterium]